MRYTRLQQNHCMKNRDKSNFCIVDSNKACISADLANLIYDKEEKNQVLGIETKKQELCILEKREQKIKLDKEQDKSPYETLLI